MPIQLKLRRGTASQWTSANPVLAAGEVGFETDSRQFKVGNGSDVWSVLTYSGGGNVKTVFHGFDTSTPRPPGAKAVQWIGFDQPDNAQEGDILTVAGVKITHNSDATLARPDEPFVMWTGSVMPDNGQDGDVWMLDRPHLPEQQAWDYDSTIDGGVWVRRSDGELGYPGPHMKLTFTTVTSPQTVLLPVRNAAGQTSLNVIIDWGDGSALQTVTTNNPTHVYTTAGSYDVVVSGVATGFGSNNTAVYGQRLTGFRALGRLGITDMFDAFRGANSLNAGFYGDAWDTSSVTNMGEVFSQCVVFDRPVGSWDTSLTTNMGRMFFAAEFFDQPIGFWDTSSVTNMSFMFGKFGATFGRFNQDISGWDTSNVTNMRDLFTRQSSFNQDIGGWDVSKVTDMTMMFNNARSFNQDIGGWDVSSVTNMSLALSDTFAFNQNIGGWNTSAVTNMSSMLQGSHAFNQDISGWDVSNVTNMSQMFLNAYAFNQNIGAWDTSSVTNMQSMFRSFALLMAFNNGGSPDINNWNTSSVTNMQQMFRISRSFNQPIGDWDTSSVTSMSEMFLSASAFNQNIGGWNVSSVTNMANMFDTATTFNNGGSDSIKDWDTSSATNISSIFNQAIAFNQPLTNWDTSKNTSLVQFLRGNSHQFNQPVNQLDTSKVVSLFRFAEFNPSFNQPVDNWDTRNVTNFRAVFLSASSWNQDISTWNLGNMAAGSAGGGLQLNGSSFSDANYQAFLVAQYPRPTHTISSMASADGGARTSVTTSSAHDLTVGNLVTISGTTSYNAQHTVHSITDSTTYVISTAFVANESGTGRFDLKMNGFWQGSARYEIGGPSESARAGIISDYNWTINDGGGI